jgi:hypothetical protein
VELEDSFERLTQRDKEFSEASARGRRRALALMGGALLPVLGAVALENRGDAITALIPVVLVSIGGVSYSWSKWRTRPEDSQSIAFVGLDRSRRRETYRSLWHGKPVSDPVVLTILESMHEHVGRSLPMATVAVAAVAGCGVALVRASGSDVSLLWVALATAALVGAGVVQMRWIFKRAGAVIDRSRS